MKAVKRTVTITVETLSLDVVPNVLMKMGEMWMNEVINGHLMTEDGDFIEWETETKEVEF